MSGKNRLNKLWSVYIGEFYNSNHDSIKSDLINYFKEYMKKNPNSRRGGENYKLYESGYNLHALDNKHFKKLISFIAECILTMSNEANKKELQNIKEPKFQVIINDSWFINYEKGGFVLPHLHPNCSWCCVYYVQIGKDASETNGATFFEKTLPFSHVKDFGSLYNKDGMARAKPEEGKLVVWPHFVKHGSIPYTGEKNRIIVSANASVSLVKK